MKKIVAMMMALTLMVGSLTGCGQASAEEKTGESAQSADDGKLQVVTTIFPEYDWVLNILGDEAENAEVTMLLDNGVDLHSYQPTAQDIMKIASCDLFIYVGGESDAWVEDALAEATNQNMVVINLMEVLGDRVKEEEVKEGMQAEEEEGEEEEGEEEYDEHVWLSLKNASALCEVIASALSEADEAHAADYQANAQAYIGQLNALDSEYQSAVDEAVGKTLLFGDRFPFRYLTEDYGLDYYAAFVGCSAETEASFETVIFLADKVDELGLSSIMTIEGSDGKIAETIRNNTAGKDQKILSLNSMQSLTSKDVADGLTYYSIMEQNLEVLKEALH